jgi:hypothetical protein
MLLKLGLKMLLKTFFEYVIKNGRDVVRVLVDTFTARRAHSLPQRPRHSDERNVS